MGLEVYYPRYDAVTIEYLMAVIRRYQLVPTGGTDFHGPRAGYPRPGRHLRADEGGPEAARGVAGGLLTGTVIVPERSAVGWTDRPRTWPTTPIAWRTSSLSR